MSALEPTLVSRLTRRHLRFGWSALAFFLSLGVVLEMLHGFKVPGYLNEEFATRRLMWTLAHAHGTLVALVNVGFVVALPWWNGASARAEWASQCLMAANVLLLVGVVLVAVSVAPDPGERN